ncbi:cysteine sulfinic acid decarboxylase-like [Oppia nitens]|uniref:cysteine sulfinic acid decarboxylase-like n=1 Tax=Oppia nitens TaxID=1686743 RepID=UPI0023DA5FB6|nr:cysteine sulfinic acid decarboxylase-like [Oppia nitens]
MTSNTGNEFLRQIFDIILNEEKIVGNENFIKDNHKNIVDFKHPKELENILELTIGDNSESDGRLIDICRKVIRHSIKTCHPNFYNQLYGGAEQYALSGAFITDALNTSAATYEISPVFSVIEKYLIKYLGQLVGYDYESIDGMFAPGGSSANMYAMVLARQHAFPDSKRHGVRELGQLVMFASEESHYSFVKSAIWLGLGTDSVIKVKADLSGHMRAADLRDSIKSAKIDGKVPFMVAATAGTTVLGAFDPLGELADVCREFGDLWFHVDAALGGGWLFSPTHGPRLLADIERANSVTWDLHKLTCTPQQCNVILTRHPTILYETNSLRAEYLFQSDKYYDDSYDSGDKSIQCGRKSDTLKLWLQLKAYGGHGMAALIDNVYDMAIYITEKLRQRPGFRLVMDKFESNLVSFWYIPPLMRSSINGQELPPPDKLSKVAPLIKRRMMDCGSLMIGYQPLTTKQLPNFFRLSLTCLPKRTVQDMDFILDEIERLAEDINF